jgi:branched-chain amino acid aminotransferase
LSNEIVKDYIIHNGSIISAGSFDYNLTKVIPGVYEVIRIIDGVPLFMEKHMSRFRASAKLMGFELKASDDCIAGYVKELIKINNCNMGNVKIIINNLNSTTQDNFVLFIKSKYPTELEISSGVPTILYYGERNNPNAKSTDLSIREKINQEMSKHNAYEALLVNRDNQITEGSRSNLFFVKGNNIYTSPAKNVLQGVTRNYIIEICSNLGHKAVEAPVLVEQLPDMDGLFLTGTSPQVLPISSVDDIKYSSSSNSLINEIRKQYEKLVHDYIISHK